MTSGFSQQERNLQVLEEALYHAGMDSSDAAMWARKAITFMDRQFITHGRHCPCTPCRVEDWTNPRLAHCGMHGPACPPVYAPLGRAGTLEPVAS